MSNGEGGVDVRVPSQVNIFEPSMPQVFIPPSLRRHTGGVDSIQVSGTTVREIVASLEEQFPGIRNRLCEGEQLRPGLAVAIDSTISDLGLLQKVGETSEVHFVSAVGGG